ncbi:hydrogenase expression/formation protein HypD [Chitinophaga costaii]|uniref:Hydrogenase expression/formation protein HypD n=1 Tax=Chitinophaga costaii TaxID=1335309 RepID=A0A1C4FJM3_9BACT|nr:hydrogenase formation protein HypD [Chitinophaga costaii]PUZ30015.1 hydrogenase formation protein HypD [Chitinophaga costaii]SCC56150.1 hydrogenase expression/formation protein HypD [Chitinophaga costaii]
MKYLSEYRDADIVAQYLEELKKTVTRPWNIMEICGGQTHSLVKNGLLSLMPDKINMVHGPGCPVCVTPLHLIDKAIYLATTQRVILCSFGDMLRVPGSTHSLLEAKAAGADVRILYSPLEAVKLAKENPDREVVFFAVGFETTAPANALSVLHAQREGLRNYSILTSHVLVPPAMEAIAGDDSNIVQGFLGAGHVCTIMGLTEYYPIVAKYKMPIVVTGFEPVDLLQGIVMLVRQLERGAYKLENQYSRFVQETGNTAAQQVMQQVFEVANREWRGIGNIPLSGLEVRADLALYDANKKFDIAIPPVTESKECIAGQVLRGIKKPYECPQFGKKCTPTFPLGAPMVSSEGACAAYYHFSQAENRVAV